MHIGLLHALTHRQLYWEQIQDETLLLQMISLCHCEMSIYMYQYSNSICIWSIYLSIYTIFKRLCFLPWFSWRRVIRENESDEPTDSDYPFGIFILFFLVVNMIEDYTVAIITWLAVDDHGLWSVCRSHKPVRFTLFSSEYKHAYHGGCNW
jgi:hypothetical protein